MIKRVTLLVTILILSLSASALAAEPSKGVIEGKIVNETEGGSTVAGQNISLKTYLNDAEVDSTSIKTDAQGHFVFDGLSTDLDYVYEVAFNFQQAEYYSEWLNFDEGEATKSVEIIVYDSTTSNEAIKVSMAHTVIYVGQGSLKVMEYLLFANDTDRAYIGSRKNASDDTRETLRFTLPREITDLQITMGLMECCIMGSEGGFVDTMPVLPGDKEIAYSYEINYNSGTYTFSQDANYPTTKYDFLFQGESIEITSNQLKAEEPMDIEGTQFNHLSGSDFAPGDIVVVQLSGLPETSNQGTVIWVALALVVLICGFSLGYLLKKKRLQPASPEDSLDQRRQRLLIELAQLDDDFGDGKISEEAYRKLRVVRKAELIELMQRSKEEGGNR